MRRCRCATAFVVALLSAPLPLRGAEPATVATLTEAMAAIDIQRTTLDVELSPERGSLAVSGSVSVVARRDGVSSASLVLAEAFGAPTFSVAAKSVAARSRSLRWSNADARLWEIDLPTSLARGKSMAIEFQYEGRPDWGVDGRITPNLSWMLPQAAWYPRLGTGRIAEDDWSFVDLTLAAPATHEAVGPGAPREAERGRRRWRSRLAGPAFFVASAFEVETASAAGKTVACYSPRGTPRLSPTQLDLSSLLRAQQDAFGAYPHPRLAILRMPAPWPTGEAYAAPGALLLDDHPIDPRRLAHELAHQWWGLSVQTPLLEGLARYAEQLDGVQKWQAGLSHSRTPLPPHPFTSTSPGGSYPDFVARHPDLSIREALHRFDEPVRTAVAYDKLAAILSTLQAWVGDDDFVRLLKEFHRRHAGQRAGLAEFQTLTRSVTRQDLDWFFSQWVNGPGMPSVRLEQATASANGDGFRLSLRISQTRPPFRLRLPYQVTTSAGSERGNVELMDAEQTIEIETKARPTAIELDPARRILMDPTSVLRVPLTSHGQ